MRSNNKIQLIINDVRLPTTTRDRYQCYPVQLREQLTMIAGNVVQEVRGTVQRIVYSYDFMGLDLGTQVLRELRRVGPINVAYLPDDSDDLITSTFLVEELTPPTLSFYGDGGRPLWHNIAFVLREVEPHD